MLFLHATRKLKLEKILYSVSVLKNIRLSAATFLLTVERPDIEIKAGQCFNVGTCSAGVNREYSMYSDANANHVEFLIREVENGIVSPPLASLSAGDNCELSGPYGEFCIENAIDRGDKKFLFIGTGTGVAPFRSFVKTFPKIDFKIIHGVRYEEECYNSNEYSEHNYIPCISRPSKTSSPQRVTDFIKKNPIDKNVTIYICGNRKMVVDVFDICREQGINGDNIFTEVFF